MLWHCRPEPAVVQTAVSILLKRRGAHQDLHDKQPLAHVPITSAWIQQVYQIFVRQRSIGVSEKWKKNERKVRLGRGRSPPPVNLICGFDWSWRQIFDANQSIETGPLGRWRMKPKAAVRMAESTNPRRHNPTRTVIETRSDRREYQTPIITGSLHSGSMAGNCIWLSVMIPFSRIESTTSIIIIIVVILIGKWKGKTIDWIKAPAMKLENRCGSRRTGRTRPWNGINNAASIWSRAPINNRDTFQLAGELMAINRRNP